MIETTTMSLASLRLHDESFSNPRTFTGLEPTSIMELALDILRRGLLVPLLVTGDGLVVAGQRRYRALELLAQWRTNEALLHELPGPLNAPEIERIEASIRELVAKIPVRIVWVGLAHLGRFDERERSDQIEGIALADNLLRADLSSYEIAERLWLLHEQGVTGAQLARLT